MSPEIADELRRMHSTLSMCPTSFGDLCLRCRAAREIERLMHEVRVLSLLLAEYMPAQKQVELAHRVVEMLDDSQEDDYEFDKFWD